MRLQSENSNQVVFIFNENGMLLYSNKLPRNHIKQIVLNKKAHPRDIHIREIFSSQEIIQLTEETIKSLVQSKIVLSKFDSCGIHYTLNFDFLTKEYQGFTMCIDKQTFQNVELNDDKLP